MENLVELKIHDMSTTLYPADAYALVLEEVDGGRKLPIIIGQQEAQAIKVMMMKYQPPRPLTHDLFQTLTMHLGATLKQIVVTGTLQNGITILANAKDLDDWCVVIDMVLRSGVLKRIVIPIAKVTEVGEISYVDNDAVGYETTLTCQPDASENTHYEYIQAT